MTELCIYQITNTVLKNDLITEAIIYIMHEDRPLGCPTKHYYDICLEGYCRFGFKQTVLEQALYDSVGKRVEQHLLKEVGYYYEQHEISKQRRSGEGTE